MAISRITCPVCDTEQIPSQSCINCGVFFEKIKTTCPICMTEQMKARSCQNCGVLFHKIPRSSPEQSETKDSKSLNVLETKSDYISSVPSLSPVEKQPASSSQDSDNKPEIHISPQASKPNVLPDASNSPLPPLRAESFIETKNSDSSIKPIIPDNHITKSSILPVANSPLAALITPDQTADGGKQKEEQLWTELCGQLENEEKHHRYIGFCLRHDLMLIALKRYGEKLKEGQSVSTLLKFQSQLIKVNQFYNNLSLGLDGSSGKERKKKPKKGSIGMLALVVSFFCMALGLIQTPMMKPFPFIGGFLFVGTLFYYFSRIFIKLRKF